MRNIVILKKKKIGCETTSIVRNLVIDTSKNSGFNSMVYKCASFTSSSRRNNSLSTFDNSNFINKLPFTNTSTASKYYKFYKFGANNFCKDPKRKDKEEDEHHDEDKPPKGFEKFYRKRSMNKDTNKEHNKEPKKESKDSEENKTDEEENKEDKEEKEKKDKNLAEEKLKNFFNQNYPYMIVSIFILFYLLTQSKKKKTIKEISLNEFNTLVDKHQIKSIEISKDKGSSTFFVAIAELMDNSLVKVTIANYEQFLKGLEKRQYDLGMSEKDFIPIKLTSTPMNAQSDDSLNFILLGILAFCTYKIVRSGQILKEMTNLKKNKPGTGKGPGDSGSRGGLGGFKGFDLFDFGKMEVKDMGTEQKVKVKFKNVAGMQQAKTEVVEFVDFLKHPEKYNKLGAKIPRGALLVGPPGTGKTLLAKAVAGEAGVPFIPISGSNFVEMFVGVGASRVRDLFKKAKEKAPSIIFIDEIDAVGRKRGGKFTGGHDERDNTLNQLLVEMDGFGTDTNVIVLAATNRVDILDNALLRPGRFDRQIEINLPDRKEREDIFKIYLKKVKLDHSKTVDEYATRLATLSPGFSGADIANLVNEAAIISARENKNVVDSDSFEKATDRIIAGIESKKPLSEKERTLVAYHESGHAVAGWFLEHADTVLKLTIIPRSKGSLGHTQFLPDDIYLRSREHLMDLICGLLGGRVAEEHFFKSVTTGAGNDLQKATAIAEAMVTKYGMSTLGLISYAESGEGSLVKPYSPETEHVSFYNLIVYYS